MNTTTNYKLKRNLPIASFYYRGKSHSHPVRRMVAVVDETKDKMTGYEIRNGRTFIGDLAKAPIKSFKKCDIAKYGDYQRLRRTPQQKAMIGKSTLVRMPLSAVKVQLPVAIADPQPAC